MKLVNSISLGTFPLRVGNNIIVEYSFNKCYAKVLLIDKDSDTALVLFDEAEYPEIVYLSSIIKITNANVKGKSKVKYLIPFYQKKLNERFPRWIRITPFVIIYMNRIINIWKAYTFL